MSDSTPSMQRRITFVTLWRLGGLSIWQLIRQSIRGFRANQLEARSSQFAYYSTLALAPLLIVVIACVAQFPLDGVLESFMAAVGKGMPDNAVQLIDRQVHDIQAHSTLGLIGVGLLLLGIAGSRVFLAMGAGLDAAYGADQRRRFWRAGGLSLALTFGALLLLLLTMVLLVVGPMLAELILRRVAVAWIHVMLSAGVRWGVACGFLLIAASVIYWLVPSIEVPWYWLSPGSLFATSGWVLLTQGLRYYAENFGRYNETYGALGGVVVLMIWLYLTGALLLMGGEINGVIHQAAVRDDFQKSSR